MRLSIQGTFDSAPIMRMSSDYARGPCGYHEVRHFSSPLKSLCYVIQHPSPTRPLHHLFSKLGRLLIIVFFCSFLFPTVVVVVGLHRRVSSHSSSRTASWPRRCSRKLFQWTVPLNVLPLLARSFSGLEHHRRRWEPGGMSKTPE